MTHPLFSFESVHLHGYRLLKMEIESSCTWILIP
nr:MAG TPA: hypothetical protein [Caudoviricetes sp.]